MSWPASSAVTLSRNDSVGSPRWSLASNRASQRRPRGSRGTSVEVDQPGAGAVAEAVADRCLSGVGHDRVDGASFGASVAPVTPSERAASSAGAAAVLVEAPAVVRAGEGDLPVVQLGQPALRGDRLEVVDRVLVVHLATMTLRIDRGRWH